MPRSPVAILNTGFVASIGQTSPAVCAAIRAKVTNHTTTHYQNSDGEWILGAEVALDRPWRGRTKLLRMLTMSIEECVAPIRHEDFGAVPLLLCVAEEQRAGRLFGLDGRLAIDLSRELAIDFDPRHSAIIADGRASAVTALAHARELLETPSVSHVVIAAGDSLLVGPTLAAFEAEKRLLTAGNSNGFIPGEASVAVLVGRDTGRRPSLLFRGVGLARERATIRAEEPLRADGLTEAIRLALTDAGCDMHDLDFRITDSSGEYYYFKEAALALSRTLRRRREEFDMWHPAECIGEVGAAAGAAALAVAWMACRKAYAVGPRILLHAGSDEGLRGAVVCSYEGST
jgi:3-oxoacyl-[acyl-carrier-protein] synthase I